MPVERLVRGATPSASLAPWPADAPQAAIAVLRTDCGISEANASDSEVGRIGAACAALVQREAPGAPQAVRDEAVIRFAAYVYNTTKSQGFQTESMGPRSTTYIQSNHAAAFRHCSAKALLSPWKARRGGVIR